MTKEVRCHPKMDAVVCAQNLFKRKGSDADFARDCITNLLFMGYAESRLQPRCDAWELKVNFSPVAPNEEPRDCFWDATGW
jgi:hypothetical protein